jgi:hypothetical protein
MKRLTLLAAAMCLVAAPLAAQQHAPHGRMGPRGQDMMAMMREMMAPLMPIMAYEPGMLLDRRDSLKLTADQVTKLTAIRDAAKPAHDAGAADFKTHAGALASAFQGASPDTNALKPHFDEAHAAMGKAHWAALSAAAQAKAVLTDDQRKKVDAAVTRMMQREHM